LRKTTIHIIIILLILFVSCKKETKTDEKAVVEKTVVEKTELKTESKTEQVDTLENRNEKINQKKKPKREVPTDTLLVQKDTLFIESFDFSKKEKGIAKCKGKVNGIDIYFIAKTNDDSEYLYCFGANPKRAVTYGKERNQPHTVQKLTVLLLKENNTVYELNYELIFYKGYVVGFTNREKFNITNIDETLELSYGQAFCGGVNASIVFFRKNNKLIKGLQIEQGGEPGTEYFYQNVILPKNNELNQIWIETKVGKEDIVYFTDIEKHELKNDSLLRLNSKKDNFYFVKAKSGLTQRSEPSINGKSLGKLTYKTKVRVLNRTDIEMTINDGGKLIKGYWVQIEYKGEQPYDHSFFVFDGYLSKNETNK
jgi:hypothetical protein